MFLTCEWRTAACAAEPEVHCHTLAVEDEFMVVACDGLWDLLSSQRCVEIARRHLRDHNDPHACAQFLVHMRMLCWRLLSQAHALWRPVRAYRCSWRDSFLLCRCG